MGLTIAGLLAAVITLSLRIGELPTRAELDRQSSKLRIELRTEIRESNEQLLRSLAGHVHTEDGDAVFTRPTGANATPADN